MGNYHIIIGYILGYLEIIEEQMETAIVYCSYIRMEKKMETTGFAGIKYRDYRVYIGLH